MTEDFDNDKVNLGLSVRCLISIDASSVADKEKFMLVLENIHIFQTILINATKYTPQHIFYKLLCQSIDRVSQHLLDKVMSPRWQMIGPYTRQKDDNANLLISHLLRMFIVLLRNARVIRLNTDDSAQFNFGPIREKLLKLLSIEEKKDQKNVFKSFLPISGTQFFLIGGSMFLFSPNIQYFHSLISFYNDIAQLDKKSWLQFEYSLMSLTILFDNLWDNYYSNIKKTSTNITARTLVDSMRCAAPSMITNIYDTIKLLQTDSSLEMVKNVLKLITENYYVSSNFGKQQKLTKQFFDDYELHWKIEESCQRMETVLYYQIRQEDGLDVILNRLINVMKEQAEGHENDTFNHLLNYCQKYLNEHELSLYIGMIWKNQSEQSALQVIMKLIKTCNEDQTKCIALSVIKAIKMLPISRDKLYNLVSKMRYFAPKLSFIGNIKQDKMVQLFIDHFSEHFNIVDCGILSDSQLVEIQKSVKNNEIAKQRLLLLRYDQSIQNQLKNKEQLDILHQYLLNTINVDDLTLIAKRVGDEILYKHLKQIFDQCLSNEKQEAKITQMQNIVDAASTFLTKLSTFTFLEQSQNYHAAFLVYCLHNSANQVVKKKALLSLCKNFGNYFIQSIQFVQLLDLEEIREVLLSAEQNVARSKEIVQQQIKLLERDQRRTRELEMQDTVEAGDKIYQDQAKDFRISLDELQYLMSDLNKNCEVFRGFAKNITLVQLKSDFIKNTFYFNKGIFGDICIKAGAQGINILKETFIWTDIWIDPQQLDKLRRQCL